MSEKKHNELKKHLVTIKSSDDKIYNSDTHDTWREMVFRQHNNTFLTWAVFKIVFENGDTVYNYSNEKGVVIMPDSNAIFKLEIDINPTSTKSKSKYYGGILYDQSNKKGTVSKPILNESFKIEIDINPVKSKQRFKEIIFSLVIVCIIIFSIEPIFLYLKAKSDPVNIAKEKYVFYNNLIVKKQDSTRKANPKIYIYTNDTTSLSFTIHANIDSYQNPNTSEIPYLINQMNKALQLENFINNEQEEGYDVFLKTAGGNLFIANYKSKKTSDTLYNISQTYYYTKKEKESIKKDKNIQRYLNELDNNTPPIDSLQKKGVIFSKKELKSGRYDHPLKQFYMHTIDIKNPTHKFYFGIRSKNSSKQELQNNIEQFREVFLNNQPCNHCEIRKIEQSYK